MRLFVGLRPTEKIRTVLSELQSQLQAAGIAANYLDRSNLHMTLAFIGEWPDNVCDILPVIEQPFSITFSHVGLFRKAKVIWAGIEDSDALNQLAQQVRVNLSSAGIPFDPQPFVPHITLARKPLVPEGLDLSKIEVPAAVLPVADVFLYCSNRVENGMVYSVIGSSSGQGGAAR